MNEYLKQMAVRRFVEERMIETFKDIDGLPTLHLRAYGRGLQAKYDADAGEVCVSHERLCAWLTAEEARALRDWLVANVRD